MRPIDEKIIRGLLFFGFFLISSPLGFVAAYTIQRLERMAEAGWIIDSIHGVCVFYLIFLWWLAHLTSKEMVDGNLRLGKALRSAFSVMRLQLAFVPVFGHWFEPSRRKSKRDLYEKK